MNSANPTVPWVIWDEKVGKVTQIFVSRLVGGATGHFVIANGGKPISSSGVNATRPDITFSGHTPYVTWRQPSDTGVDIAFVGHFVNAASPTFVLDGSSIVLAPSAQADVREPISSACIATPFNSDGSACQGGSATVGTPFLLFTAKGASARSLFADAYQPATPVTGAATGITASGATLHGSVNPLGASVRTWFQYGTTTAYGTNIAAQTTGVANAATPFSATISGLAGGTTFHYRTVVVSDFRTFVGADHTFTTS
jgi:hypothetical protein